MPQISHPYMAEMEFFKEVRNVEGKPKTKIFPDGRVTSPFYFLLKLKELENNGTVKVRFYRLKDKPPPKKKTGKPGEKKPGEKKRGEKKPLRKKIGQESVPENLQEKAPEKSQEAAVPAGKEEPLGRWAAEKQFSFGEEGKYYEYVLFFDRIDVKPGGYRYVIFYNDRVLYGDRFLVSKK